MYTVFDCFSKLHAYICWAFFKHSGLSYSNKNVICCLYLHTGLASGQTVLHFLRWKFPITLNRKETLFPRKLHRAPLISDFERMRLITKQWAAEAEFTNTTEGAFSSRLTQLASTFWPTEMKKVSEVDPYKEKTSRVCSYLVGAFFWQDSVLFVLSNGILRRWLFELACVNLIGIIPIKMWDVYSWYLQGGRGYRIYD